MAIAVPTAPNPYDHPAYLAAAAAHEDGAVVRLDGGLSLLRVAGGALRNAYGYPQPEDPERAAAALLGVDAPWSLTLAEIGPAAALADVLRAAGASCTGTRDLALAPLRPDEGPLETCADRRGRRAVRTALRDGCTATVAPLDPGTFAPLYADAMAALGAAPIYRFAPDYFAALTAVPGWVVSVTDAHGLAAAAFWLDGEPAASYHLGGRRTTPEPPRGAMHLALVEGLREAARRGRPLGLLGGGRTAAADDPLLAFKAQLAPGRVARLTFTG
jgi:hypothetical protein